MLISHRMWQVYAWYFCTVRTSWRVSTYHQIQISKRNRTVTSLPIYRLPDSDWKRISSVLYLFIGSTTITITNETPILQRALNTIDCVVTLAFFQVSCSIRNRISVILLMSEIVDNFQTIRYDIQIEHTVKTRMMLFFFISLEAGIRFPTCRMSLALPPEKSQTLSFERFKINIKL